MPHRDDDISGMLQALLAGQQAMQVQLAALMASKSAPIGTDSDAKIGLALVEAGAAGWMSARQLFALRLRHPELARDLDVALVDDVRQLSALLGRLHRRGLSDRSERRGGSGRLWQLTRR